MPLFSFRAFWTTRCALEVPEFSFLSIKGSPTGEFKGFKTLTCLNIFHSTKEKIRECFKDTWKALNIWIKIPVIFQTKHGILNIINQVNQSFLFGHSCSFSASTHYVHNFRGDKEDRLSDVGFALVTVRGDGMCSSEGFHFQTKEVPHMTSWSQVFSVLFTYICGNAQTQRGKA